MIFGGKCFSFVHCLFFYSPIFLFPFFSPLFFVSFSSVFTELGNIPAGKWNHIRLPCVKNAWFLPSVLEY